MCVSSSCSQTHASSYLATGALHSRVWMATFNGVLPRELLMS
jgi:hypothetical protein